MSRPGELPPAPTATRIDGQWQWGRYRTPFATPNLHASVVTRFFRQKEWHYTSIVTDRWFIGFALVHLGYAANVFLYVVDRAHPDRAGEYEALSPLGAALRFAPSSVSGATTWTRGKELIAVRWANGWTIDLDVPVEGKRLVGRVHLAPEDALALLYPLAPERPAYTHKSAGLRVDGELTYDGTSIPLDDALGTVDWTRSLARRETRWKWASFAGRSDGQVLGLNLSAEVYDDDEGNSRENGFWVNGRVTPLPGVRFEVPRNPGVEDWRIRSRDGDAVELVFEPLGARSQQLDLRLVKSDFVQPYGLFRGRIQDHAIDGVFGVVEDHRSVW